MRKRCLHARHDIGLALITHSFCRCVCVYMLRMRTQKSKSVVSEACFSCYPLLAPAAKRAHSSICRSRGCKLHSPPPPFTSHLLSRLFTLRVMETTLWRRFSVCNKGENLTLVRGGLRSNPPMRLFIGLC